VRACEAVNDLVEQISDTEATVVITGETGVGKSRTARKIHKQSSRSEKPFVEINCATIPENLIESELFGYEGGAFTGANAKGRIGKIEMSDGGTLFLDEIGELPIAMQTKFLHVIQEKKITRVGGVKSVDVNFRLIVATNRDIYKDVKAGAFREDLFYRLNVIPIYIPPLREHKEDILPLIAGFLEYFNKKYKKNVAFSEDTIATLEMQEWPGNIRQVENLVERMVITARDDIVVPSHLPNEMGILKQDTEIEITSLKLAMEEYERKLFVNLYKKYHTSVAIGQALKISQSSAVRKLRQYVPEYLKSKKK
jgi:transcriptional regulator with PAS, ATPase and Fis domain